ncbi:MAG TPA: hypothetical protein VMP01_22050 [Pirellulaceae bacterium]|nr:hypothetical protein [Pirellulaceae bacterium]
MLLHIRPLRGAFLTFAGLALATAAGCDSGPAFVGTWNTDQSPYKDTPSGDNDVRRFLSPAWKFSVKFDQDGSFVTSWSEDGKEGTRSGTWTLVEGDGLRWRLNIELQQPDADDLEVRIISRSNRAMSLESLDPFRNKGGAVEFKKG